MHKSSKKKNVIVSILLIAAIAITGAFAYLTATDTATNLFTVGNVVVELTEPNWAPDTDSDSDGINDTMSNIVAGQVIAKDPTITNKGNNDAYVYIMVEIPKVYETEITGADGSAATQQHYPLFSFDANDGWSLIDSQVGTEDDAYDYYLYAYDTALAPDGEATLFDKVKFANITDNFVNTITGEAIVDLDIKVTGYAIQSDYYNGEATDAASAWSLYATQNDWAWPENPYDGLSTLNYLNEDKVIIYSETNYTGTPVEMYFEPSLAKQGYTFDWVDTETSEIAYSGMPLPEGKTNLIATYEGNGYENDPTSDYIRYAIKENLNGELYASVTGLDDQAETYPTSPATVIIPTEITFTATGTSGEQPSENGLVICDEPIASALSGEVTVPVLTMFEHPACVYNENGEIINGDEVAMCFVGNSFDTGDAAIIETLVIPDTITAEDLNSLGCMYFDHGLPSISAGSSHDVRGYDAYILHPTNEYPYGGSFVDINYDDESKLHPILSKVVLPYNLNNIGLAMFTGCINLKEINIPKNVKTIDFGALQATGIESLVIPASVTDINAMGITANIFLENVMFEKNSSLTKIGTYAFDLCLNLKSINIPTSVKTICDYAFYECDSLSELTFSEDGYLETIGEGAFHGVDAKSIVFPNSLKSIGRAAFEYFEPDFIKIPNSLEYVGQNGLRVNPDGNVIPTIHYAGTADEWDILVSNISSINGLYSNVKTAQGNLVICECNSDNPYYYANYKNGFKSYINSGLTTFTGTQINTEAFTNDVKAVTKDVVLNEGITSIANEFYGVTTLETITIPASVTSISTSAFTSNKNLKEIIIDEDNETYYAIGTTIYKK